MEILQNVSVTIQMLAKYFTVTQFIQDLRLLINFHFITARNTKLEADEIG
jgi:hypothetical protein